MSGRTNQYFIPGDGISREVIQADICRYLGHDALVRPGNYQGRDGYVLTAYRNLTSPMIADLKADSQKWEAERRESEARGYSSAAYRTSTTHHSRQYYGPTDPPAAPPTAPVYGPGGGTAPSNYEGYYSQSSAGYPPQPPGNYSYSSGGNYAPGGEPRSYSYPSQPGGPPYDSSTRQDSYYSNAPPTAPGGNPAPRPGYQNQPREPYGRGGYNYPQ